MIKKTKCNIYNFYLSLYMFFYNGVFISIELFSHFIEQERVRSFSRHLFHNHTTNTFYLNFREPQAICNTLMMKGSAFSKYIYISSFHCSISLAFFHLSVSPQLSKLKIYFKKELVTPTNSWFRFGYFV